MDKPFFIWEKVDRNASHFAKEKNKTSKKKEKKRVIPKKRGTGEKVFHEFTIPVEKKKKV